PGSIQPAGLRICAILTSPWPELTRPTYSSISFGLLPAASIRVGLAINLGTVVPPCSLVVCVPGEIKTAEVLPFGAELLHAGVVEIGDEHLVLLADRDADRRMELSGFAALLAPGKNELRLRGRTRGDSDRGRDDGNGDHASQQAEDARHD